MKLEQQVTSRELSQKLKDLGVKQESLFCWHYFEPTPAKYEMPEYRLRYGKANEIWEQFSAFTVAELGEMLPSYIQLHPKHQSTYLECFKCADSDFGVRERKIVWKVGYNDLNGSRHYEKSDTEAEARGLMLCYLLENKLITL